MVHEPNMYLIRITYSFAPFSKIYFKKTGMHMNFYFIGARRYGVKHSIHYYMIAFIIVWYLHVP